MNLTIIQTQAETSSKLSAKEQLQRAKAEQKKLLQQKQDATSHLKDIQKQKDIAMQKAMADMHKARQLNKDMVKATQQLQLTETKVDRLTKQVDKLNDKAKTLDQKLKEESRQFSKFLPLLERLSLYPTDTLLAAPIQNKNSTLGLSIIKGISKQLEKQAQQIVAHQKELTDLQEQYIKQSQELEILKKQQEQERDDLTASLKDARIAQEKSSKTATKISQDAARAASKARNINDAINRITATQIAAEKRLEAEAKAAEKARNIAKAQKVRKEAATIASKDTHTSPGLQTNSKSGAPVSGSIITLWGSHTDSGPAQGVTYAPQSQATVTSPCNGRIEFAGPFRAYGEMVILNCGKNYRFVLAGMGNLNVGIGQSVQKGVMIGRMPAWSGGKAGRPTLFVQLRQGSRVVNPSPFL